MVKTNLILSLAALAAAQASASTNLRLHFRTNRALESASSGNVAPADDSSSGDVGGSWGWPAETESSTWSDSIGPFGQCGGSGYDGNTTCVPNWVCVYQNEWYSQCLQPVIDPQTVGNSSDVIDVTDITDETPVGIPLEEVTEEETSSSESPEAPIEDFPTVTESIGAWQQCGGLAYSGSSDCIAGYQCDVLSTYYHQCVPIHSQDKASLWSPCGGAYHTGPTDCVPGAICVYYNDWYSQCVPNEQ